MVMKGGMLLSITKKFFYLLLKKWSQKHVNLDKMGWKKELPMNAAQSCGIMMNQPFMPMTIRRNAGPINQKQQLLMQKENAIHLWLQILSLQIMVGSNLLMGQRVHEFSLELGKAMIDTLTMKISKCKLPMQWKS